MSRKWKQINKFIEVFDHALASAPVPAEQALRVADFGSGKGYLTFAMHDYLRNSLGREAQVTGVELRQDMVDLCNAAAARLEHPGLEFQCGDVRSVVPEAIEVMIALHACDIATDYAIHTGIRCNAAIIMCSPCCHKQIRPQLHSPGCCNRCCSTACTWASRPKCSPTACARCTWKPAATRPRCSSSSRWSTPTRTR
jgi:SAM-dependent methyltransferase